MKTKQIQKPNLEIVNGQVSTTSLDVAENFEKEHSSVLKTIRKLECSQQFAQVNFDLCSYKDANSRSRPMYRITRDDFSILVMGFTGKKAMQWKEKYISAFNRMEEELKKQWLAAKLQASRIRLSDWSAIVNLRSGSGSVSENSSLKDYPVRRIGPQMKRLGIQPGQKDPECRRPGNGNTVKNLSNIRQPGATK